ncbi:[FeFe] hydrogenase, group A [Clostridium felsineum]|uniref:[FeFe] hydrogenase, group A n=1 Tax=Clostridium felsineum TaxID=36839 RepID=UPI00098C2FE3|nr:[FeFe] hydrogenase, group A [Clostridium felsineum]
MERGFTLVKIDKNLCTGCEQCKIVCPVNAIKGKKGEPQNIDSDICVSCGQCVQICSSYSMYTEQKKNERKILKTVNEPMFAAFYEGKITDVEVKLKDKELYKIVQCAPAVRVSLAEEFGFPSGSLTPGKLAAALRLLNFDKVYDTNFAADLTIMEEGSELVRRVTSGENLPMFTSCCPAWVKYIEQTYPELLNHLSSCRSPQQMAGSIFKTYGAKLDSVKSEKIYSVAVMPCTCKQFECDRPEMIASGYKDVDAIITTRELAQLIKAKGIDFKNLKDENFDTPLGKYSGAGNIFGVTGGVMEAALRTGYSLITKEEIPKLDLEEVRGTEGIIDASITIGNITLKVAVVCGLKNIVQILESVKNGMCKYHFIEVMTCPKGCISGGGQPKFFTVEDREKAYISRRTSMFEHDKNLPIRKSHENPYVKKIYKEFLGAPLGKKSHHLLHTQYTKR